MEVSKKYDKPLDVLILAAGLGTRMRSSFAKVLHKLDGKPLISHVCETALALKPRKIYTVIGHQGEEVKRVVTNEIGSDIAGFAVQEKQQGTGDAANSARQFLENQDSVLLVLSGDVPLVKQETLELLLSKHFEAGADTACTALTVELDNPFGYGRIVRNSEHKFLKIVEQKDGSDEELAIKEINSGIYCFDSRLLYEVLREVKNNNAQGEYYLTEVPRILNERGLRLELYVHPNPKEIEGVNNRKQLAEMEKEKRTETIERLMLDSGVSFIDPENVYVGAEAEIESDTVIYPGVSIEGKCKIGSGCTIRSGTRITNSRIGNNVEILDNCVINEAEVLDNCNVGPFAHLRPNAKMEEGSRVGNFVEMKKSTLGKGSKANHLSYLGDAIIGENSNIGAGTITCNYDGKNKHVTQIGNRVRIGSDTMLVAPVTVGDGVVTGAGSVVTKDIEKNKLAVGTPAKAIRTLNREE
ncbi:MAG: bifunctional UDP-N-acetylglucosamine diphosphorylase/glucosamine-1-phosphate N-acetyltransferase GlmU [Pyrinomonadaceae bacterium]